MKHLIPLFLYFLISLPFTSLAQVTAGVDTSICPGGIITRSINLDTMPVNSSYVISDIPFNPDSFLLDSVLPMHFDDGFSAPIPIGFPFTFYGHVYDSLVVSSNDYLSFTM